METGANKTDIRETRIAVIGVGGVGGYLSGMLLRTFPHVTLVARGRRKEALEQNGLVLHSQFSGESVGRPERIVEDTALLAAQDLIFVCVKNYSLDEVLPALERITAPETVIVPVMNGVDAADRIRAGIRGGQVIDTVIYTVSYTRDDYSVVQEGDFTSIRFGRKDKEAVPAQKLAEDPALFLTEQVFSEAGIDHKYSEKIEVDIWRKYILNCAFNVETAAYQKSIGELRSDPKGAEEYAALVREAALVARAKGIPITDRHEQMIIDRFQEYQEEATSSLQRDIRDGKRAETDTFSGFLIREARKNGIEVPVSEKMFSILCPAKE